MATHIAAASTPSPPPSIRTPSAPRFGAAHDNYEPYAPRKSSRISSQRSANRTPSPSAFYREPVSPRTAKKPSRQNNAAMVSPAASPRKKRQPPADFSRRVSGNLTAESTANASAALGLADSGPQKSINASVSRAAGMFPTPSKTPRKTPNEKAAADISQFARNLFPSEDAGSLSPRKKRSKKYSGMTMESFAVDEAEDPIEIFTDSQDRVPEKDESSANPFFGDGPSPEEPSKRRSRRRQVMIPGEGSQSVDEASRRDDGMVYVFRGKKFFRKFSDNEGDEEQDEFADGIDAELTQPLTRSTMKPRLLFQEKTKEMLEDEEAMTDVEDMNAGDMDEAEIPATPVKTRLGHSKTPEAPKFAPVSPPDTKRTTRSTNKLDETPVKSKPGRKGSLFDYWPRTKEHKEQAATKRQGESLASTPAKRTRT